MEKKIYFSTYTILNWIHLLESNEYKEIIIQSLRFLVINDRVNIYGFVIMPNHIHLLWEIKYNHELKNVQRDFLKFTAQTIRYRMIESSEGVRPDMFVNSKDRKVQIWERNGFSFELNNYNTILQKLNYIHKNPINKKWNLCKSIEEYEFSSYHNYFTETSRFDFVYCITELA